MFIIFRQIQPSESKRYCAFQHVPIGDHGRIRVNLNILNHSCFINWCISMNFKLVKSVKNPKKWLKQIATIEIELITAFLTTTTANYLIEKSTNSIGHPCPEPKPRALETGPRNSNNNAATTHPRSGPEEHDPEVKGGGHTTKSRH